MSAYLCDDNHIAYLVTGATDVIARTPGYGNSISWLTRSDGLGVRKTLRAGASRQELQAIGTMLRLENERSLGYRYPDDADVHLMYKHPPTRGTVPIQLLAAIRCYRYQACETPEYYESEAEAFCQALDAAIVHIATEGAKWGAPEHVRGCWQNGLDPASAPPLYF